MYSYDWIVMITLGLDRWEQDRRPSPHEIELREIRKRQEARRRADQPEPPKGWRRWLARRWPQPAASRSQPSSRAAS